jgi:hypothetical protein
LGAAEELARALERTGYPPLRTRSPRDAIRPALILDETKLSPSGIQVEFDVPLPSIYLLEQIAPLTTQDEQKRYYLTPSSIVEAQEQGIPFVEILRRLRALHRGPLPHAVEKQIRAWGHYYGDAATETMALVQVQDTQTLNELLAEPEIRALLQPFVPDPERALATVSVADLEKLRSILADYGVGLRDGILRATLQMTGKDHEG